MQFFVLCFACISFVVRPSYGLIHDASVLQGEVVGEQEINPAVTIDSNPGPKVLPGGVGAELGVRQFEYKNVVAFNRARVERTPGVFFVGNINRKYFYVDREAKNWTSAKSFCENLGMKLARIDTEEERTFLYVKLPSSDRTVWLGAKESYKDNWPKMTWEGSSNAVETQTAWFYDIEAENALVLEVNSSSPNSKKYGLIPQRNLLSSVCYMTQ